MKKKRSRVTTAAQAAAAHNDKPDVVHVQPSNNISPQLKYEVLKDHEIDLTKQKAIDFLELSTFSGERIVNEMHVQHLYNAWASGRFMWAHVILGLCQCEGKTYRVNGQHTAWMRLNIDKEIKAPVREITYRVDDEEALRGLYSTFDRNKNRSETHIARALLTGTEYAQEVWPSVIGSLTQAMKMWLYGDWPQTRSRSITSDDMVSHVIETHGELFRTVGVYYQSKFDTWRHIRKKAVLAGLFATFNSAPNKAREFWDPVTEGIGLESKRDMRWLLRQYIETHHHGDAHRMTFVSSEELYCIIVQAWNKWRKGVTGEALRRVESRPKVA